MATAYFRGKLQVSAIARYLVYKGWIVTDAGRFTASWQRACTLSSHCNLIAIAHLRRLPLSSNRAA